MLQSNGIVSGHAGQAPCFVGVGTGGTGLAQFTQLAPCLDVVDTRGYAQHGDCTTAEIRSIASNGIADGHDFARNGSTTDQQRSMRRMLEMRHQVGAFAYVHNVQMEVTPEIVDSCLAAVRGNQKPAVVLTHIDTQSPEALATAKLAAAEAFGVSDSHLFCVEHVIRNPDTDQVGTSRGNEVELLRLMAMLLTQAEDAAP